MEDLLQWDVVLAVLGLAILIGLMCWGGGYCLAKIDEEREKEWKQ